MSLIKEYFAEEIAENARNHPEWNTPTEIRTDLIVPFKDDDFLLDFDVEKQASADSDNLTDSGAEEPDRTKPVAQ
jgi:hypothetical protein